MANEIKNYFLAPGWDYDPKSKPGVTIALWNIVSSPKTLIPPLAAATVTPAPDDIATTTKTGFEWMREREKEKKFGVWTKFLSMLAGIGIDIRHKRSTSVHDQYTFKEIVTNESYPTMEYLEKMVKEEPVKKYLEKFDFQKPVYIVVGTKVVSGANVKQMLKKSQSTNFKLGVDGTHIGAPVSLGPEMDISNADGDTIGFAGSSDFVFAFRIRKIIVNRQFEVEDVQDEDEGTALGDYDDEHEKGIMVGGLDPGDSNATDHYGSKEEIVGDGDEQVRVVTFVEAS